MRTKILSFIILGFIIPQVSFGAVIAGWNATSTTQGWVSPTRINGVDQTIAGKNFISTSTNENVLTNLKIVNSTTTNATSTSLGVTYINTLSSAGLNIHSNNGTDVALFGAGGGTNTTLYGGTNVQGILSVTSTGTSTFAGNIDVTGNVKLGGNLFAPINLQLSGFTQGSALFVGPSGTIAQNNSKLFWDNTNFRLGIGTTTPFMGLSIGTGNGSSTKAILVAEHQMATSTSITIDWKNSNQQLVRLGNAATTISFTNYTDGGTLKVITCNPPTGTAGAITWGTQVLWAGGTAPTQTTTATHCDVYSFLGTMGTSTLKVFGAQSANF